jgi:hypothetical protein
MKPRREPRTSSNRDRETSRPISKSKKDYARERRKRCRSKHKTEH